MSAARLPEKLQPFGPVALVTGASDGIGRATAVALAAAGFDLLLVARRKDVLAALAADLSKAHGVQADVFAADLGVAGEVDALARASKEFDIGTAVLAAGFGTSGPLVSADVETERDMIRVNCEAVLQLSQVLGQRMIQRKCGQLVLFGSLVGFQGAAFAANYSATKAYVQTLAEGLAQELKPSGVRVVSVAPGPVKSGFEARADMTLGSADSAETVAAGILRSIGKSGTIRPGFLSKVLGYNLGIAPRWLRLRIMSRIMSGLSNHKV